MLDSLWVAYADPLFWTFPVAAMLISFVSFLGFAVPFTILAWRQPAWAEPYRIQRRATGARPIVGESLKHVAVNNAVMLVVTVAAWPLLRLSGVHGGPLPAWWVVVGQFLFFIVLDDSLFYWAHRYLHENKWLFAKVHRVHHRIMTPWALTGHYMHPVEYLLIGAIMLTGPVLIGAHVLTVYIWIVYRQWEAAEGHAGYDFPYSPTRLVPLSDGATHHDYHHAKVIGNYAGFFPWNDILFGTCSTGYAEDRARRRHAHQPR